MMTEADVKRMQKMMKSDKVGEFIGRWTKKIAITSIKIPTIIVCMVVVSILFIILGFSKGINSK